MANSHSSNSSSSSVSLSFCPSVTSMGVYSSRISLFFPKVNARHPSYPRLYWPGDWPSTPTASASREGRIWGTEIDENNPNHKFSGKHFLENWYLLLCWELWVQSKCQVITRYSFFILSIDNLAQYLELNPLKAEFQNSNQIN